MKKEIKMRASKEASLKEVMEWFLTSCKAKNLSSKSITYYESCFQYFAEFFDVSRMASDVTIEDYNGYVSYLFKKRTINEVTINSYLRGLRAILYFGMERKNIEPFRIQLIRAEKKIKETYTDEELMKLLVKPNLDKCSFSDFRDWVIVNYLLATGNRLSSVANLRIGDLVFENSNIVIRKTKNRKQQVIPMSTSIEKILKEYLSIRKGVADDYAFCDCYGNPCTSRAIQSAIYNYNKKRGVTKTSTHLFRHTFAKKWILNGGDIFRLQKILGHSSLDIVKEYVNMFSNDLQMDFDKFNPLESITRRKKTEKITF